MALGRHELCASGSRAPEPPQRKLSSANGGTEFQEKKKRPMAALGLGKLGETERIGKGMGAEKLRSP